MAITTPSGTQATPGMHQLAARLLELLREEHLALERNDVEAISGLLRAKERAIAEMRVAAGAAVPGAIARGALAATLRQAAAANTDNGQRIDMRLAYMRARFAGLDAAAGSAGSAPRTTLYRRDGRSAGGPASGGFARA